MSRLQISFGTFMTLVAFVSLFLAIVTRTQKPIPFPIVVGVIIPVGVVVGSCLVWWERRKVIVRLAQISQADERLAEFARVNAQLTQELLASQQLEEAHLLQVRALDAFIQGVVITDPTYKDNPIVFVNKAFTRMTGYSKEEVIGRNCRFLQGAETAPETVQTLREAVATQKPCSVEIINYRKDGTPFYNSLSIAPLYEDGQLTHFVGVQTDVTQTKKMEQQLRHTSRMEAIGHLAGGIAHDFNNLLTIINGSCELLRYGPPDAATATALVLEIETAGQRAAMMTRQLLTYSRKVVLQPRVLSLNDVIKDFQKLLVRLIGENITLATALQPHLSNIRVDPGQMEQVLMNLVVNARDAMMPRGGTLTIQTTEEVYEQHPADTVADLDFGSRYMCLRVTDTGCGMDTHTQARIFEPFFTTKPVGQGTGLGLAMVYGFVAASGGAITVNSRVGVGTTVTIRLPCVTEFARPVETKLETQPRGTESLLVVEDEVGVRKFVTDILRQHGYQALSAADGQEALQIVRTYPTPIPLLLTDVVMPRMSGRELAEQVRDLVPEMRVIFMSGYTNDDMLKHGISEAETDFLHKPFTIQDLLTKVRAVLDRKPNSVEIMVPVSVG